MWFYEKEGISIDAREQKRKEAGLENQARAIFSRCMGVPLGQVGGCRPCGGMTNHNFYVEAPGGAYILRIPGAGTDQMIDRAAEEKNSRLAEALGIHVHTEYFDRASGVKVAACIPHAQTLTSQTARREVNMGKTAHILYRLHHCNRPMCRVFDVRREYESYRRQAREAGAVLYPGLNSMEAWFYRIMGRMDELGWERCPCHNDLVPENFIQDGRGRMYLVDWEYAGENDPMWDVGSHMLECGFLPGEELLYLHFYYGKQAAEPFLGRQMEKIRIFQMSQDILWSLWTVVKEAKGESFGLYGRERLERAMERRAEYERIYGRASR